MSVVNGKYRGTKKYVLVYSELIVAARKQSTVKFMEIARLLGITKPGGHMAAQVGQVLGEISEDEVKSGRPMLSAIAVNARGEQGKGFFELAKDLGLRSSEDDQDKFWDKEREKVYECWKAGK